MARIEVLNPFAAAATITSSSMQGHHTPYGGTMSCDLDVDIESRGAPVRLRVRTNGPALRGRVESVRPACASGRIEDGGSIVVVALDRETGESTGLRVGYAHLDPVEVAIGDVLNAGDSLLGKLGPEVAQDWGPEAGVSGHAHAPGDPLRAEYHSSCARHSHLHLEGFGAEAVMRARNRPGLDESLMSFTSAGDVVAPDVVDGESSFTTERVSTLTVVVGEEGEGNSPTPTVVEPVPLEAQAGTYMVQGGESLLDVAAKLGVPLAALVAANPTLLQAGELLTVPGQVYVVRPRDTLAEIARRFAVELAALIEVNAIANPDVIEVGQVLTIPR